MVSTDEIQRLGGRVPTQTGHGFSARNRFEGVVRDVEISGVVALVTLDAGPYTVVSVITRDSVDELGLAPGVKAVATVKATSVMIARDTVDAVRRGARRPRRALLRCRPRRWCSGSLARAG